MRFEKTKKIGSVDREAEKTISPIGVIAHNNNTQYFRKTCSFIRV